MNRQDGGKVRQASRRGRLTDPRVVRLIHQLRRDGKSTGEIERELHLDPDLAEANIPVPSTRTIYSIAQEVRIDEAGPAPRWRFFDHDMRPEDARLVMDYYEHAAGFPQRLGALGIGFEQRGDGDWPPQITSDLARRYVRVRRAYPELGERSAMKFARFGDIDDERHPARMAEKIASLIEKEVTDQ